MILCAKLAKYYERTKKRRKNISDSLKSKVEKPGVAYLTEWLRKEDSGNDVTHFTLQDELYAKIIGGQWLLDARGSALGVDAYSESRTGRTLKPR